MADVSDAVTELMVSDVIPNMRPEVARDPNFFRRNRLYTHGVNELLTRFKPALLTIFREFVLDLHSGSAPRPSTQTSGAKRQGPQACT